MQGQNCKLEPKKKYFQDVSTNQQQQIGAYHIIFI